MYRPPAQSSAGARVPRAGTTPIVGALVGALLLALSACPSDPYDAKTWVEKLDNAREVERAITELSRLKDPKSIKPLGAAWRKHNRPARVLRVIIDIADQHDMESVDEEADNVSSCQGASKCKKLKDVECPGAKEGDDPKRKKECKDRIKCGQLEGCDWKPDEKLIVAQKKRVYGPYWKSGPFWAQAIPFLYEAIEEFLEDEANARAIENATVAVDALGRAKEAAKRETDESKRINVDVEILRRAATLRMPPDASGQRVRLAALRALGKFDDDARAAETLINVLNTNVEEQHLHLFAAAADALALGRNTKAIEPLIRAMYGIPPVYQFCRRSLVAIGEPAVPHLINVFNLKDKKMNAFAKEHDFAKKCKVKKTVKKGRRTVKETVYKMGPKTTCKAPTNLEFKAAQLLGDLHAKSAVPHLLKGLKKEPMPAFFSRDGAAGPSQHQAILDALRNIGDESAAEPLRKYILDPKTDDLLRPMAIDSYSFLTRDTKILDSLEKFMKDDQADFQVRVASGLTYGRLARTDKQLEPLNWMIKRNGDKVKEWEGKAKPAAKDYEKIKKLYDAKKTKFDEAKKAFKALGDKATKAQKAAWAKKRTKFATLESDYYRKESDKYVSEGNANDFRIFKRTFEQHLARAKVGIVCKDDPKCYIGYLDKSDEEVAATLKQWIPDVDDWDKNEKHELKTAACERALLEISKMGVDKAAPVLNDLFRHLPSTERFIRQGTLLALLHVAPKPCQRCIKALDTIIHEQETQSTLNALTADARVWRYYFRWAGTTGSD